MQQSRDQGSASSYNSDRYFPSDRRRDPRNVPEFQQPFQRPVGNANDVQQPLKRAPTNVQEFLALKQERATQKEKEVKFNADLYRLRQLRRELLTISSSQCLTEVRWKSVIVPFCYDVCTV